MSIWEVIDRHRRPDSSEKWKGTGKPFSIQFMICAFTLLTWEVHFRDTTYPTDYVRFQTGRTIICPGVLLETTLTVEA